MAHTKLHFFSIRIQLCIQNSLIYRMDSTLMLIFFLYFRFLCFKKNKTSMYEKLKFLVEFLDGIQYYNVFFWPWTKPINQTSIEFMGRKTYIADFGEKVFAHLREAALCVPFIIFTPNTNGKSIWFSRSRRQKTSWNFSSFVWCKCVQRHTSNFFSLSLSTIRSVCNAIFLIFGLTVRLRGRGNNGREGERSRKPFCNIAHMTIQWEDNISRFREMMICCGRQSCGAYITCEYVFLSGYSSV